jgi:Acylphosphatase
MKEKKDAISGTVTGNDQHVGFRAMVMKQAIEYNLAGFTKNLPDDVELHPSGRCETIDRRCVGHSGGNEEIVRHQRYDALVGWARDVGRGANHGAVGEGSARTGLFEALISCLPRRHRDIFGSSAPLFLAPRRNAVRRVKALGYNSFCALATAATRRPRVHIGAADRWRGSKEWQSSSRQVAVV